MSTRRPNRRRRTALVRPSTVSAAVAVVGLAVVLAVFLSRSEERAGDRVAVVDTPAATGETNSMGMPILDTPGEATGTAAAGPVEVAGANWALGRVPLNVAVRPAWMLRNMSDEIVTIGQPHAEIREGCCPGPFGVPSQTIPPGGEVPLTFELSMHPGMDGWHDMAVHVPLMAGSEQHTLTLGVTGDFRD